MTSDELIAHIISEGYSISTDTRTLASLDIYIGIKGETFDGGNFADDALKKGALFAVVNDTHHFEDERIHTVPDTTIFFTDTCTRVPKEIFYSGTRHRWIKRKDHNKRAHSSSPRKKISHS